MYAPLRCVQCSPVIPGREVRAAPARANLTIPGSAYSWTDAVNMTRLNHFRTPALHELDGQRLETVMRQTFFRNSSQSRAFVHVVQDGDLRADEGCHHAHRGHAHLDHVAGREPARPWSGWRRISVSSRSMMSVFWCGPHRRRHVLVRRQPARISLGAAAPAARGNRVSFRARRGKSGDLSDAATLASPVLFGVSRTCCRRHVRPVCASAARRCAA